MAPKRKNLSLTPSSAKVAPKAKKAKKIVNSPQDNEKENNNEEFESDDELCEYEKLRLQNIRERQSKFDELNLSNLVSEVSSSIAQQNKKIASRRGLSAPKKEKLPLEAVRKSLRLQNIDADTGLQLPEKEPTRYHVFEDETPQRPPLTDLTLEDLSNDLDACKVYFDKNISPFASLTKKNESLNSMFGNAAKVGQSIKSLKILPERVAKVVPDRIFSLAIHPSTSKLLVAAGGKWGSIGFWDVHDTTSEMHGVQVIKPHSRPINCLTFDKFDATKLISTSYDGSVRLFDIKNQKSSVLFGLSEDDSSYTTYHCQIDSNLFLVTLGRTGEIGLVDKRVSYQSTSEIYKVYNKASPKMVSVHPLKPDHFVTPSSKGECGIYDRRMGKKNLMTPVSSLMGHSKAISSALFSPQSGDKVVTVSYDNRIRLFDTKDLGQKIKKPFNSINHNNQTGRWLTTFKAEWHPKYEDVFFVGSMSQPRQIDVYTTKGDHFNLKGEDLASVCSIVKCHPTQDIIVGGNSSGRVHVFM